MLNKKDAISVDIKQKPDGGMRATYTFICSHPGCTSKIKARQDYLKRSTGLCKTHVHRKNPFESTYHQLIRDDRGFNNTLTYEEFLTKTNQKNCHYCLFKINWQPYSFVLGEFTTRAYFLDRKDCQLGYTDHNTVVCCTRCNRARGNRFTYEEWFGMTQFLRAQHNG